MTLPRRLAMLLPVLGALLPGATLEQLTVEQMVQQSTAIVRAKALESRSIRKGALIYTRTRLEVLDQWKGTRVPEVELALPGGQVGALSQQFSGVPVLSAGQEIVVFLWAGPSGRVQLLGLTQGLFDVVRQENGSTLVRRRAIDDLILAPGSGKPVVAAAIEMPLEELATQVGNVLLAGGPSGR